MTIPPKPVRLDRLLVAAAELPTPLATDHDGWYRSQQTLQCGDGVEADMLFDCSPAYGITVVHTRFRSQRSEQLKFVFSGVTNAEHGRGYLARHPRGGCIWLPVGPVARRYDPQGRIASEKPGTHGFPDEPSKLELSAYVNKGEFVDIPLVLGRGDEAGFVREITALEPVERIRLNQDAWYDVHDPTQLWDYLVHGRVHDPRWEGAGKRIECQQCAHTWYSHLAYLHRQTGKRLYGALRDVVAHSVLLSLPSDHRWRHGEWTDGMETHTRFQTDGIHLLLQHYSVCGDVRFLEAACAAADYLLGIADTLDDRSVWYLHDTLELDDDPSRSGFPGSRRSRAFGKHRSNTLCLNTHVWTLTALWRLTTLCQGERRKKYEGALTRGMSALQKVLCAEPATALYGGMYRLRDACLRRASRAHAATILKLCDTLLRRLLRRSKPRFPRLAMPNGYIERDLERSTLADRYVPVNLKDLALLSNLTGAEWLRPFVERGLSHWLSSGLWQKELSRSPTVQQTLDAALLLAATDTRHGSLARQIYHDMRAVGRAITVDALGGTAGTDTWTIGRLMPDTIDELLAANAKPKTPGTIGSK